MNFFRIAVLVGLVFFPSGSYARVFLNTSNASTTPEPLRRGAPENPAKLADTSLHKNDLDVFLQLNVPAGDSLQERVDTLADLENVQRVLPPEVETADSVPGFYLLLSGGGLESMLHIGALKAIEKYRIPIYRIGGSSWGAVIGALWSVGYSAKEIESIFLGDSVLLRLLTAPDFSAEKQRFFSLGNENFPSLEWEFQLAKKDGVPRFFPADRQTRDRDLLTARLTRLLGLDEMRYGKGFESMPVPLELFLSSLDSSAAMRVDRGPLVEYLVAGALDMRSEGTREIAGHRVSDGRLFARFPVHEISDTLEKGVLLAVDSRATKKGEASKSDLEIVDLLQGVIQHDRDARVNEKALKADGVLILRPYVYRMGDKGDHEVVSAFVAAGYQLVASNRDRLWNDLGERVAPLSRQKTDFKKSTLRYGQTVLENVSPENQAHMRSFLAYEKGDSLNFETVEKSATDMIHSGLYSDMQYRLEQENEKVVDVVFGAKARNHNLLQVGGFGEWSLGPAAALSLENRFVNQFEFSNRLELRFADYHKSFVEKLEMSRVQGLPLFLGLKIDIRDEDFRENSSLQAPKMEHRLLRRNVRRTSFEVGRFFRGGGRLRSRVLFDNSEYYTGTLNEPTLLGNVQLDGMVVVHGLALDFYLEDGEEWLDNLFASAGSGYRIQGGFHAISIPEASDRGSAPLYSRWRVTVGRNVATSSDFLFGILVDGGIDLRGIGNGVLYIPDTLEIIAGKQNDLVLDDFYRIQVVPTWLSRVRYLPGYRSHAYGNLRLNAAWSKGPVEFRVHPQFLFNFTGEDKDRNISQNVAILELLLRSKWRSLEFIAGVEYFDVKKILEESSLEQPGWRRRIFFSVGNFRLF